MVTDSYGGLSLNEQPIINPPNYLESQEPDVNNELTEGSNNLLSGESCPHLVLNAENPIPKVGIEVVNEDLEHNCLESQEPDVNNELTEGSNNLLSGEISPHLVLNAENPIPKVGIEVVNEDLEHNDYEFFEEELNQNLDETNQLSIQAAVKENGTIQPEDNLRRKSLKSDIWRLSRQIQYRNPLTFEKFSENCRIFVGNGNAIQFWNDPWVNGKSLAILYPRIASIILAKDESLAEVWLRKEELFRWEFNFRRNLFVWEEEELERLIILLDGIQINIQMSPDHLSWNACSSKSYSVSSMYNLSLIPASSLFHYATPDLPLLCCCHLNLLQSLFHYATVPDFIVAAAIVAGYYLGMSRLLLNSC
ncbi:hypothetical protein Vadar_020011 [Vaccinium darrowii]|uniref:Uncharacterized protein n=1 Tax=Vaccinium darrowii TaxID=229202 RepID=A0ACB7X2L4_9ERIC|nr:hypothetical protein Vadar_020011 [Vaccinium darrowii]